jgi:hypothetical protein
MAGDMETIQHVQGVTSLGGAPGPTAPTIPPALAFPVAAEPSERALHTGMKLLKRPLTSNVTCPFSSSGMLAINEILRNYQTLRSSV